MAWQPQEEPLRQLAACLKDSLSQHNQTAQKQATQVLTEAKAFPDINNYLVYLTICRQAPPGINLAGQDYQTARYAAAIMLKNDVRDEYKKISPASLAYVHSSVLIGLQDPDAQIRNLTGNVITELSRQGGIVGWRQLLPELLAMAGNDGGSVAPEAQEGAMSALAKVCEDNKRMLDRDFQGQRPLDVIFPKLLTFAASPLRRVRALALNSINVFIPDTPPALLASLDALLSQLFQLANDPDGEVRRQVCRAFVLVAEVRPQKVAPYMEGLVEYFLTQQRNEVDQELAVDAAEFWLSIAEQEALRETVRPFLPKIIPALLDGMVYSEEDIMTLGAEAEDAEEEDKAEDIRPQFAKSKAGRHTAGAQNGGNVNGVESGTDRLSAEQEDELSEGEIDEYTAGLDDDDDEPEGEWNLRKCSGAALDVLSSVFHKDVFDVTLPYLKQNLRHEEWPKREAAVLALGAIASGCLELVEPHLPDLVPYLISLLDDAEPVVRSITCWTLGRYSGWAARLEVPADKSRFFEPMMEGLLTKMLDNHKRVQEAAAAAFASLEEQATQKLVPYCEPIVQQFVRCFAKYKDRNVYILYDCVQTLAEHVGPALSTPAVVNLLLPPLIQRWNKLSDQSRELMSLLECLSYVAAALGTALEPFAPPLFSRCIRIIHDNLGQYLVAATNADVEKPEKDFVVTSLDLVSAIIQVLEQPKSGELVLGTQPPFFELLAVCMEDASMPVRQSAYAVLGDSAIYVPGCVKPYIPSLMPIVLRQLDLDAALDEAAASGSGGGGAGGGSNSNSNSNSGGGSVGGFGVLSNACWASGELSAHVPDGMAPYVEQLYERMAGIALNPDVPQSVHENAAVALGRLGMAVPAELAPRLTDFAERFLDALERVAWTEEKISAFEGFAKIVALNPQDMEHCLAKYFEAMARYAAALQTQTAESTRLQPLFRDTVSGFRQMIPDFNGFFGRLSPQAQQALQQL